MEPERIPPHRGGLGAAREADGSADFCQRLELEATVSAIATRLVGAADLDEVIRSVLADLGAAASAERAFLLRFADQPPVISEAYEWCLDGSRPSVRQLRGQSCEALACWMDALRAGESLRVASPSDLPDDARRERDVLEACGGCLLAAGVSVDGRLGGVLGVGGAATRGGSTQQTATLLSRISPIVARALAARAHNAELERRFARCAAELRETERQYRALVENLNVAVFRVTTDPAGRVLQANPAMVEMFGYDSLEEFMRAPVVKHYVDPADRQRVLAEVARTGRIDYIEIRQRRKDGTEFWVSLTERARHDENGRARWLEGVLTDITERKRAADALRASERRYRGLVESQQDFVVRVDPAGVLTFVNDAYCRVAGKRRDELLSLPYRTLVHREDADVLVAAAGAIRQPPHRAMVEVRLRTAGGWRWTEWESYAIHDASGRLIEIQGVGRDVTDRKEAEQALRLVDRRLMTARETERRHLAAELHDAVGQSLVALKLSLQNLLAADRARLPAEAGTALDGAARQCADLIREIRHICQGLYPPALESFGLAMALRQMAGRCSGADVRAEVVCARDLAAARFGNEIEIALFRIAQEAVSNALRHSRGDRIELALLREDESLVLTVCDNGVGFDASRPCGCGLGLSTMKRRAGAVDGELTIRPGAGGTRVEARVPITTPPDRPAGRPGDADQPGS